MGGRLAEPSTENAVAYDVSSPRAFSPLFSTHRQQEKEKDYLLIRRGAVDENGALGARGIGSSNNGKILIERYRDAEIAEITVL